MIVLMRHARTEGGEGRCIGRTPIPLSDEGRRQSVCIAEALHNAGFARLCCSPSRRALDTISPLAERIDSGVDILPALDEIDMGEWDGLLFDDVRSRYADLYGERGKSFADFRPPNGENFNDVAERAVSVLKDLASGPQSVIAVTHAGVLRAVQCRLTGHPMDDLFHFKPEYGCCTLLESENGELRFVKENVLPQALFHFL